MKKSVFLTVSLWVLLFFTAAAWANNMSVSSVSLINKDTGTRRIDVRFTVSWQNSWRVAGAPAATANWDAAWIFVKYSVYNTGTKTWGAWTHATLSSTDSDHTAPAGSTINTGLTSGAGKGIFIYSSSTNTGGTVTWTNAAVRWLYGTDGVLDGDTVKAEVFAIEMVSVPQGSFHVGDGTATSVTGQFCIGTTTASPFNIAAEDALTLGGGGTNLGNNNASGMYTADDFNNTTTQSLPAAFPKGFAAFCIMKYEISQRQYCEFLNTLISTQSSNRITNNFNTYRNYIKLASNGKYGCDASNNAGTWGSADYTKMNETDDGGWTACNYLSWADGTAYAAWSALRPFTELEFEKACRGGQTATDGEYAWGTATIASSAYTLSAAAQTSEGIATNYSTTAGNCNYSVTKVSGNNGPLRAGIFAANAGNTGRMTSGAGYYGIMELSGNLWERPVTIGNSTGRLFTGLHGNGSLDSSGNPSVSGWPGTGATGAGFRGGGWDYDATYARVSDRYYAALTNSDRSSDYGGRCARTSP